jgi:alkylmercury lyase
MPASQRTLNELTDALLAAVPPLDPMQQHLVVGVYRALARGLPVAPAELADNLGMARELVQETLDAWPGVYRDNAGNVIGFWGLALSDMPHELDTGVATVHTWCALDPFLITPLLPGGARVRSTDPVTGAPISLTITDDGIHDLTPATTVVSMLIPDRPFDAGIVHSFCHYVHFFGSPQSGREWTREHPGTFLLDIDQTNAVARATWPSMVRDALETGGLDTHITSPADG